MPISSAQARYFPSGERAAPSTGRSREFAVSLCSLTSGRRPVRPANTYHAAIDPATKTTTAAADLTRQFANQLRDRCGKSRNLGDLTERGWSLAPKTLR